MGMMEEVFADLLDEEGALPPEKLGEATERLTSRLKLSGKEVAPAVAYQVEQEHMNYVIRNLFQQIIMLKGEFLDLVDGFALSIGAAGDDYQPNEYDPEADFAFMMQALAFDKIRRLYERVMV